MMFISCSNGVHIVFVSYIFYQIIQLANYVLFTLWRMINQSVNQSITLLQTPSQTHSLRRHCWITSTTCNPGNNISRKSVAMHKDWSLQCHFLVLKSGLPFLTVVEKGCFSNLHYDLSI